MPYGEKSLLRFTTTGSVDDGKFTLIGRLLYETKSIYEAKWMIKRRQIAGTLYLGVMKDNTKPEKLAAHAWVKCGQIILTGAKGHRQYTVVSTFS